MPTSNKLCFYGFSPDLLRNEIERYSNGIGGKTQTGYLGRHLSSLGAKSLVIETHYIDRYFIDEYSFYYSRCLQAPKNSCARIHVFSEELDETTFTELLLRGAAGKRAHEEVEKQLSDSYLGYIVVRPLPSVPIGRTVVPPLSDKAERKVTTARPYISHLLGFKLPVLGLAFQQQDRAVAVCATTALWAALQTVCHSNGIRPPTPTEIGQAAFRNFIPDGRPFPASGLRVEHLCEALRSFDFAPDLITLSASSRPEVSSFLLMTYVRSGMPAILCMSKPGSPIGHAVLAAGFRDELGALSSAADSAFGFRLENLNFSTLYIHDDRIGPYARAKALYPNQIAEHQDQILLDLRACGHDPTRLFPDGLPPTWLAIDLDNGSQDIWCLDTAVVPLYPKLRSSAREMYESARLVFPTVQFLTTMAIGGQPAPESLKLEITFAKSGDYLASMSEFGLSVSRAASFQKKASLSRYVGVMRWFLHDTPIVELLWDTTDTLRAQPLPTGLLGMVSRDPRLDDIVDQIADLLKVVSS